MAVEVLLPRLGWTMEEGTFVEWLKHDGESVHVGDILYTVESDKALTEVEALEDGILRIPPDAPIPTSRIPVGTVLAYIVQPGEPAPFEQGPISPPAPAPPPALKDSAAIPIAAEPEKQGYGKAQITRPRHEPTISPRARRIAEELGVDWTTLKGSGRTRRIVEKDVRAAQPMIAGATVAPSPAATTATRKPMSPTRRTIAQHMSESAQATAAVTLTSEVDATELVRLRAQLKADPGASRQPIPTFNDLFARLCAQALLEHPAMNSRIEGGEIVTEAGVHIGIAVDTERGLLVPVLRDVQTKSLRTLAVESAALVERVQQGKAGAAELQGSTFTISNLGMYDIDAFTPLVNLPECAILGIGRSVAKPVVLDASERIGVRQMMTLSLTFDHRLTDGAPAARFLQRVKQLVEQPYLWLVT